MVASSRMWLLKYWRYVCQFSMLMANIFISAAAIICHLWPESSLWQFSIISSLNGRLNFRLRIRNRVGILNGKIGVWFGLRIFNPVLQQWTDQPVKSKPVFFLMFDILVHVSKKTNWKLHEDLQVPPHSGLISLRGISLNLGGTTWISTWAKPQLLSLYQYLHQL